MNKQLALTKIISTGIILVLVLSLLAGCGDNAGFLGGEPQENKGSVTSKEINIPFEKVRTLNPITTMDEDAYYIHKLIYEGLFDFNENLELENILAESYTYGDGGYSATIKLKDGVKWQDGEKFTAEDVKFSIEAYLGSAAAGTTLYSANVKNIKSVVANKKNPDTVIINFISNSGNGVETLTMPIIPKHRFKTINDARVISDKFVPIGTGPYQIKEFNELSNILLVGNPDYHGKNPPNNQLNLKIMPDKLSAVNLMEVNEISLTFSKGIDRNTQYANKDIVNIPFPSNEVEVLGFNSRSNALKDKKIRKAIAQAIDTEEILEIGYYKNGVLNDNIYFPNYMGVESKGPGYAYDLTKAKQTLAEAGYLDRDGNGLVENALNETIELRILVNEDSKSRVAAADIIKNDLDKLSIRTTVVARDWAGYNSDLAAGDFDLFIGGYQFNEIYDLRPQLHTNYGNVIGYTNPTMDLLLDKLSSGLTVEEKKKTFEQIKALLMDEVPYYCLIYKTYSAVASPALKGDVKPYFHNIYNGAQTWTCIYE